jgi:hypothetical protein
VLPILRAAAGAVLNAGPPVVSRMSALGNLYRIQPAQQSDSFHLHGLQVRTWHHQWEPKSNSIRFYSNLPFEKLRVALPERFRESLIECNANRFRRANCKDSTDLRFIQHRPEVKHPFIVSKSKTQEYPAFYAAFKTLEDAKEFRDKMLKSFDEK